jgi:DNA polymerase elongation subunit (family B)
LTEYYFDIETYSRTRKPDPANDKIITIQFQELSTQEGRPEGKLQILTEWAFKSERNMLNAFRRKFLTGRDFDFIPIGENLYGFDLISLLHRLNKYFHLDLGMDFFRDRPVIDIKPILVMMNEGNFRDYQGVLGKKSGRMVRQWYEDNDYDRIERYVRREARNFITKYQTLKKRIPRILI